MYNVASSFFTWVLSPLFFTGATQRARSLSPLPLRHVTQAGSAALLVWLSQGLSCDCDSIPDWWGWRGSLGVTQSSP